MALIVLVVLAALVAAFLLFVSSRPDSFRIERSIVIDAPAPRIHASLADFRKWRDWSPWEDLDPALQRTYSGAETGTGAVYSWKGNRKAGAGTMTIMESTAPGKVVIRLEFTAPFKATNTSEFHLDTDSGTGTTTRWIMHGPSNFTSKLFGLLFDMDKLLGKNFEDGLANLKRICESSSGNP